jgi:hypothetical protein
MMEYAQYQPPAQAQHGHSQGHIQGGYPNSGQHPGAGAPITSPSQPMHSQHAVHNQASPILSSQPPTRVPGSASRHALWHDRYLPAGCSNGRNRGCFRSRIPIYPARFRFTTNFAENGWGSISEARGRPSLAETDEQPDRARATKSENEPGWW